jgi:septum formation protein
MLILASASPRRRELLTQAGYSFEVRAASIAEDRLPGEDGIRLATRLAREKAEAVFASVSASISGPGSGSVSGSGCGSGSGSGQSQRTGEEPPPEQSPPPEALLVLGADTVVVCDGELLGKPRDARDAARMLALLSGRTHQVVTGVALAAGSGSAITVEVAAELTHVTMQTVSEAEISRYVATGEPMDKAGGYAIQGYAGRWILRISGCYFNVVGLPLSLVSALLEGAEQRLAGGVAAV